MLTSSANNSPLSRHTGKKLHALGNGKIFAYTGDRSLGDRFRIVVDAAPENMDPAAHSIEYPFTLREKVAKQLHRTGIGFPIKLNTVLAYEHGGAANCCVFDGSAQPWLFENVHFHHTMGSGKSVGGPFPAVSD